MTKRYLICEAPLCVGSPTVGTEGAFAALADAGLEKVMGDRAILKKYEGERSSPETDPDGKLMELGTVMTVNRTVYETLSEAHRDGFLPVTFGGDHSLAMASIAAISDFYGCENTAVIYVDGHTDINTEETSPTGRIHGMPLAAALGLCSEKLRVGKNKPAILGENLFIIGARSIDSGEYGIVKKEGVTLFTADDVRRIGWEKVVSLVLDRTKGRHVHLSFDVDSIDGEDFPATGYVMPHGLDFDTVFGILKKIFEEGHPSSFDCVEYDPTRDVDGSSAKKLLEIFSLLR